MNIIIAGGGDVGFHLAQLLVEDNQNITLIDQDEEVLKYASDHLDVLTIMGDSSSHKVLMDAKINSAGLFIAVTTEHSTNILACLLAKQLGATKTIARTSNPEYLQPSHLKHFNSLGVDELFSPRLLAVQEIHRLLKRVSATDVYDFEKGQISMLGFTADNRSRLVGTQFKHLNDEANDYHVKVVCVLRDDKTIIVDKNDTIRGGDHIYVTTDSTGIEITNGYIGRSLRKIKNVMITGDTPLALDIAESLEDTIKVKVVIKEERICKIFAKKLNKALLIQGDPNNSELLKEEGISQMDAFIALTPNSETNILTSLLAEKEGVYKTIALVDNVAYTHISQNIGVDTIINKKILAANEIFRHVRRGKVRAIASFHGVEGEMIEITVDLHAKLCGKQVSEIILPEGAVLAGVIRKNEGIIPKKNFQFRGGDNLVFFALPGVMKALEKIFN